MMIWPLGRLKVLTQEMLSEYNQDREGIALQKGAILSHGFENADSPCHAPFTNMYFNTQGFVSPCWMGSTPQEKWSSTRSIRDIWFGKAFQNYRSSLVQNSFDNPGCNTCLKNIKNRVWPLAKAYDNAFPLTEYPTMMELELSNACNLECIMCSGDLSSGIRKKREKKPPLRSPYDEQFAAEFREFIPHLEELRFNGGEPFLHKVVYMICKLVAEIKPSLRITVATNGTVFNKRTREIMASCNLHLNISIDSLDEKRYPEIRINGNLSKLMENFEVFRDYCHQNERELSIMVNPMRNNWMEMPEFIEFCNRSNVHVWFNTIRYPESVSIWNLPSKKLEEIYTTLRDVQFSKSDHIVKYGNIEKYEQLVEHQIKTWWQDSLS